MLAKPDPPRKRGRKPLHPDLRALRQAKSRPPPPPPSPPPRHPQPLRPPRDETRHGVKKPLQPASFTYKGLSRSSRDEATSHSSSSSFSQNAASKPGPLGCVWTNRSLSSSSPSPGSIKSSSLSELKRSASDSRGFKMSPGGASGALGVHGGFGGGQASGQRPPLVQRRPESKPTSSPSPTPRDRASQVLSLRALNLQSVSKPASGAGLQGGSVGGAAVRSSLRSGGAVVKGGPGSRMLSGPGADGSGRGSGGPQNRSLNELSTGDSDDTSSSDSDRAASLFPHNSRPSLGNSAAESDTETDWRPARSLLEHVFVTDVTANFITVTVKESPTSVGFFNSRNH